MRPIGCLRVRLLLLVRLASVTEVENFKQLLDLGRSHIVTVYSFVPYQPSVLPIPPGERIDKFIVT